MYGLNLVKDYLTLHVAILHISTFSNIYIYSDIYNNHGKCSYVVNFEVNSCSVVVVFQKVAKFPKRFNQLFNACLKSFLISE